jgi:hypothetical protein
MGPIIGGVSIVPRVEEEVSGGFLVEIFEAEGILKCYRVGNDFRASGCEPAEEEAQAGGVGGEGVAVVAIEFFGAAGEVNALDHAGGVFAQAKFLVAIAGNHKVSAVAFFVPLANSVFRIGIEVVRLVHEEDVAADVGDFREDAELGLYAAEFVVGVNLGVEGDKALEHILEGVALLGSVGSNPDAALFEGGQVSFEGILGEGL